MAAIAAMVTIAAGCGSNDGAPVEAAPASLSPDIAEKLAKKSDEVAAALDTGDTCGAAHKADDLSKEVSEAEIPDELRPEVEAGAEQLVNGLNCEPKPKKEKKEKSKDEDGDEDYGDEQLEGAPDGPPGQDNGFIPPGHADEQGFGE